MVWKDILIGGTGLSLGSSVVGALPASAAKTGVQTGLGTMGSFYPVMGTLGGATMVNKQLKNLKKSL